MKRRSFLTGLLASSTLFGVTLKSDAMNIIKPKTEEEQFYEFFEKFNGFPINELQKMMYIWYKHDYGIVTMGRQTGCSTFLITLGNWEGSKGKTVLHVSSNEKLRQIAADKTWNTRNGLGYKGIHFGVSHLHGGKNVYLENIVLYDNSGDYKMYDKYWECDVTKKFMLVTQENKTGLDFPSLPHNL